MAASMGRVVGRVSKLHLLCRPSSGLFTARNASQDALQTLDDDVQYPEIRPKYPPGNWSKDFTPGLAWGQHERGQSLLEIDDVRERLEKLAGTKDMRLYLAKNWDLKPRALLYKQYITRTHIKHGLPNIYDNVNVDVEYERLKPIIEDVLLQEFDYRYRFHGDRSKVQPLEVSSFYSKKLVGALLSTLLAGCSHNHEHLMRSQFDDDVRVESFWRIGGYQGYHIWSRMRWIQTKATVAHQIRTELPLPEFLPMDDEACQNGEYPEYNYAPYTVRQKMVYERPISVSGHWIGDPCEFTHLSCHVPTASHMSHRRFEEQYKEHPELIDEAWINCGLTSSFSSCLAQAHNQGFNSYFDVTYPFTTQSLVCSGNEFQFFTYQLNTFHMWQDRDANPRTNVLGVGKKQKLFDTIEDGKVIGLNDNILKQLMKCVLLKPVDRGCDLRPHLAKENAPVTKQKYINNLGEPVIEVPKIGRFQYPRNAVYF